MVREDRSKEGNFTFDGRNERITPEARFLQSPRSARVITMMIMELESLTLVSTRRFQVQAMCL